MVLNADKCHFMCLGKDMVKKNFIFKDFIFNNSSEGKILGITSNNKITFKYHIKILSKKAGKKIGALSRVLGNLSYSPKILYFSSVIKSLPSYIVFCSHKISYFSSVIKSLPSYIDFCSVTIMILVIIIETSKF